MNPHEKGTLSQIQTWVLNTKPNVVLKDPLLNKKLWEGFSSLPHPTHITVVTNSDCQLTKRDFPSSGTM